MKKKKACIISFKKILENNFYAVALIWKNCPMKIVYKLIYSFMNGLLGTLELYFIGHAINFALSGATYQAVLKYLLIYILINTVYNVLTGILNARLEPYFNYEIGSKIKLMFLEKTAECDLKCYEDTQFYQDYTLAAAQCISRAEGTLETLSNFVSVATSLLSLSILTYIINPVILLFFIAPIFLFIIDKRKMEIEFNMNKKIVEYSRQKNYCVRTFYRPEYAKEMRVSEISKPLVARFKETVNECINLYKNEGLKVAIINFIQTIYNELFSNLLVLLYVAYQLLIAGNIQYGDCVIIVKAIGDVSNSIQGVVGVLSAFRENALFINNVKKFMNYKPSILKNENGAIAENGEIIFKNVSFRYEGSTEDVLKNVSFSIKRGQKVAIVGLNGAGKTTLIKLLLRLYDPTDGTISLNGKNIKEINLESYREMFATLLQDFHNFSISIKENILLRKERAGDDLVIESALIKSGFKERVNQMPKGIYTSLGKEFEEDGEVLSGGEYQKLALTHMFAKGSPVMILDEPSSALDPVSEAKMYSNIMESCNNNTLIFISHRMSSAKIADKILYMENGKVVEEGSHIELIKKNGKYAELFNIQAQNYTLN